MALGLSLSFAASAFIAEVAAAHLVAKKWLRAPNVGVGALILMPRDGKRCLFWPLSQWPGSSRVFYGLAFHCPMSQVHTKNTEPCHPEPGPDWSGTSVSGVCVPDGVAGRDLLSLIPDGHPLPDVFPLGTVCRKGLNVAPRPLARHGRDDLLRRKSVPGWREAGPFFVDDLARFLGFRGIDVLVWACFSPALLSGKLRAILLSQGHVLQRLSLQGVRRGVPCAEKMISKILNAGKMTLIGISDAQLPARGLRQS